MKKPIYFLIIAVFMVPTIVGYLTNADKVFSGLSIPTDGSTYLSFMNQAKEGRLLFTNMYTSEGVPYVLFRPTYLIAGWVSYITRLPNILVYHLFRIFGIFAFIFFLDKLISLYFDNKKHRNITLFICLFASGIGFFYVFLTLFGIKQYGSIDLGVTDANNFLIMLSHPHTIFSIALLTASVYFFLKWSKEQNIKLIIFSAIFAFILGFEHLFDVITIYLAIGFFMIGQFISNKKVDWGKIRHLILFALITSFPFIYNYVLFTSFPSFSLWNQQNVLNTPKLLHVIFGYGLMFVSFAGLLLYYVLNNIYKKLKYEIKFLIYWVIASLILIYSPFNIQRRFLEGLHIPFGIITGIFLLNILLIYFKPIFTKKITTKLIILIVILMLPTNFYLFFYGLIHLDNNRGLFPYSVNRYLYPEEHEALLWLAHNSMPNEAIISTYNIGNYIPSYMNRRVYLGHWAQTLDFDKKSKEVADFYKLNKPLPDTNTIKYIWYGIDEKKLNRNFIAPVESETVFKNDKVTIFNIAN